MCLGPCNGQGPSVSLPFLLAGTLDHADDANSLACDKAQGGRNLVPEEAKWIRDTPVIPTAGLKTVSGERISYFVRSATYRWIFLL